MIGLFTSMIILPFALSLGLMAGYFGGFTDYVIQYIYTLISSIPSVLLISAALLAWQFFNQNHLAGLSSMQEAENRLLMICLLLGVTNWAGLCRYIRAEVLKLRELDYIKAAKLLKTSKLKILFQHLLPNIMHMVIISIVLDFSAFVLAESVLTYIGIGVSPLTVSWGNMINAARLELARDPVIWWPLFAAFSFMFILVLACNFFADALRKALNPRE
jgi:peptide/nickel transport system permease protein